MAIAEVTDVGLVTDTKYIKCAHIIHWVKDYFDDGCDDTWCVVCLDDEYLLQGLADKHPEVDAEAVLAKLDALCQAVSALNKQNVKLADFIAEQDSFFHMKSDGTCVIGDYDGDEFDCGTYVEEVLEDLEDRFGVPRGTHTCAIIEDLIHDEFPEFLGQPIEYVSHRECA